MITSEYIVGLIDGEGSFTVYVRNPREQARDVTHRVKVEPRFYVKLIERDKQILYGLQKYFRCGNVYFQKDSRPHHQNCYRYEVTRREDLQNVIIPFFQRYPLQFPSKQNDFTIFCAIMDKIYAGDHLKQKGLYTIYKLKQKMH